MKVLIADDEKPHVEMLKEILRQNNIDCDAVYNGSDAVDFAFSGNYDLIILDIMLPKMNGHEAIKEIRRHKIASPILFLSAKSQVEDKVDGLNLGADDYLTKPSAAAEFIARVRALTRRQAEYKGDEVSYGDLTLNKVSLILSGKCGEIKLGGTEYKIMEMLMLNSKAVVEKERLIVKVWGYDNAAEYNNAEVYISFLRKRLAAIKSCVLIKAMRGIGFAYHNRRRKMTVIKRTRLKIFIVMAAIVAAFCASIVISTHSRNSLNTDLILQNMINSLTDPRHKAVIISRPKTDLMNFAVLR